MTARADESRPVIACWGELLWDRFPDGDRLGGCAANVAFHAARLGNRAALISRVGADDLGRRALSQLADAGVDVSAVTIDAHRATGTVRVSLQSGEPSYRIATRAAWDELRLDDAARALIARAAVFVYGTLAQRTPLGTSELAAARAAAPPTCWQLCDLNVRPPHDDAATILRAVAGATAVKLNEEEARRLERAVGCDRAVPWLLARGVRVVAATEGAAGSTLHSPFGAASHRPVAGASSGDAVGAGDAYTAVLAHHLARGLEPRRAVLAAGEYATRVAAAPGAMPHVALPGE